jgi:hypothetical protein
LGVTPHHLRQLCKRGLIEAELSTGGQSRIPLVEIERLERDGVPAAPTLMQESEPSEVARPSPSPGLYREASDELAAAAESVEIVERRVQRRKLELEDARLDDDFEERARRKAIEGAENRRLLAEARAEDEQQEWVQGKLAWALEPKTVNLMGVVMPLSLSAAGLPQDAPSELKHAAYVAALRVIQDPHARTLPDGMINSFITDAIQALVRKQNEIKRAEQQAQQQAQQRSQLDVVKAALQLLHIVDVQQPQEAKQYEAVFRSPAPQPQPAPAQQLASVDTEGERQARRRAAADRADLHLGHINTYLKAEYKFTGGWPEQRATAARLRPAILAALIDALVQAPEWTAAQIRDFIEHEIDKDDL